MNSIIGLKPLQFIHILDQNTNITRIEIGPQTIALRTNERLVVEPTPMVIIPPGHYCVIKDPCSNYIPGKACELRLGQYEVKLHGAPFPLYPGESLVDAPGFLHSQSNYSKAIKLLPCVKANYAIRLYAKLDHEEDDGTKREAGDKWQLVGPITYIPRPEVEIDKIVEPCTIKTGEALRIKALQDFTDRSGTERVTGEEWMICTPGAYVPDVFEEVLKVERKITLTPDTGIRLQATQTVIDRSGVKRAAGEEWLITGEDVEEYYPEIGITLVSEEKKVVVAKGQFGVVVNCVDKNLKPQLGKRQLRKGYCTFFLHPGEKLETGKVQNAHILSDNEALVLQADEEFVDITPKGKVRRKPGDKWMIKGPAEYIPPIQVQVVIKRSEIPLSKNEGIYVQDKRNGTVRAEMGPQSYMLEENEELWDKELPAITELLLKQGGGTSIGGADIRKMAYFEQSIDPQILKGRIKSRVVNYRCPSNTAVQVYNYLDKTARVVFGPDLVVLGPHENFNVLSLSAGKPKVAGALRSLCLMLGPDFITDILEVETSDHARLRIQLAFNNHFEYEIGNPESETKIFSVPDFIGFACRQIGGKIRGTIAQIPFDEFHRNSAQIIQMAVFGMDEDENLNESLKFETNNLVISSVDIQSIEPSDVKMRDSLSKSVQLAIEISTKSIEAAASHEAERNEQIARGNLERQKLLNEMESEKERTKLLELQATTAAVESTGQAKAEAQAQAERMLIECESEIEAARLKAEAEEIEHYAKLETQDEMRTKELEYIRAQDELEISKEKGIAEIETNKFNDMVQAIGSDTLAAIATAGPQSQINLLKGLGMSSTLITSGDSPVNLFMTAQGLVGNRLSS
ncbi:hypothetical protein KUTeg_007154 [Tegillarca granosa]|uniref:Major vault protein n=1 Tax=Tegillarca granosa TaxID=220873 RepID=A0ABQ9FCG1_TEGGR|nr:hypothetical protein KUTeg_007154 [Tegillarca granosa]